jgi:hypothetical protein
VSEGEAADVTQFSQIIYCSRQTLTGEPGAGHEIREILDAAREANARRGVTGALLVKDGCFAQVLEGPAEVVEDLFGRIRVDPRHYDVVRLLTSVVPERQFPDWSMGFITPSKVRGFENVASVFEHAFAAAAQTAEDLVAAKAIRELVGAGISKAQIW